MITLIALQIKRNLLNIMGYRGPAPKPSVIKEAEGNPGKRAVNADEPQFDVMAPPCPRHLDKEAKREWRQIAPMLVRNRVLTEADGISLANLCQAWATLKKLQAMLRDSPSLLVKTPSGYVQQTPLFSMINRQMAVVTKLCQEFGLTPSSRTRVKAVKKESAEEDLLSLLSRPREKRPSVN